MGGRAWGGGCVVCASGPGPDAHTFAPRDTTAAPTHTNLGDGPLVGDALLLGDLLLLGLPQRVVALRRDVRHLAVGGGSFGWMIDC